MGGAEVGLEAVWSWDDARTLLRALEPRGKRILVPGGAGDLVLAAVGAGAQEVIAADARPAQLALAELKLVAARTLPAPTLRSLLGLDPAGRRVFLYHYVRDGRVEGHGRPPPGLSPRAAAWWNAHEDVVRRGIVDAGRREQAARLLRQLLEGAGLAAGVADTLATGSPPTWAGRRWRAAVRYALGPLLPGHARDWLTARLPLLAVQGGDPVRRLLAPESPVADWLQAVGLAALQGGGGVRFELGELSSALGRQAAGSLDAVYLGFAADSDHGAVAAAAWALRSGGILMLRSSSPAGGLPPLGPAWVVETAHSRRLQGDDQAVLGRRLLVARRSDALRPAGRLP